MGYHTHIIQVEGYQHTRCFEEVASAMDDALKELGKYDPNGTPIVFGAHLDKWLPENIIVYNSEQVFSWDYLQTMKKRRVWDYSQKNILTLEGKGIKAELCPIAYMPSMQCIGPIDVQDIDILMYGSANDRRIKIYEDLKSADVNVHFFYNVYGEERDALIARSKIVLNVHYYEEAIFEIFRCSHLMANKKCIVSEVGKDEALEKPYEESISFRSYYSLVEKCIELLSDDNLRGEYEECAFNIFSKTSIIDSLRGLI